jgi:hypothetical protein
MAPLRPNSSPVAPSPRPSTPGWSRTSCRPWPAETHPTARALRDAFWKWYTHHKPQADFTLANNPYPVEARFLLACYEDDPADRATGHPWPFIDVASLLLAAGAATKPEREAFVKQVIAGTKDESHNPRWDAWVAGRTAFRALEAAGRHIDRP